MQNVELGTLKKVEEQGREETWGFLTKLNIHVRCEQLFYARVFTQGK